MPSIYNKPWYNGLEEKNEMYIGNKMSVLIGMPWMRQLRVKKSKHNGIEDVHNTSNAQNG